MVTIGDENFNPPSWRHTFDRDTTKAGIPTAQLQDLLGNTSIEVTKIYSQFNSAELQEAHDRYSPVEGDVNVPQSLDGSLSSGRKRCKSTDIQINRLGMKVPARFYSDLAVSFWLTFFENR